MNSDYLLGQPLKLATGTHLLANHEIIEDHWNVEWHVGQPELLDNPLVLPLSPWEDVQGLVKCLRDPATGLFRMWYQVCNVASYRHFFNNKPDLGPLPGAYCVGYAESEDGRRWRKPNLDVWTTPDGQRTNITFWGHHLGSLGEVLENVPGGNARFALAYLDIMRGVEGICLAWSDDGIHWTPEAANPVLPCWSDCQNNIVFSPRLERYVLITRPFPHASGIYGWDPPGHRHMRRRIAVSTSADLRNWTPIRVILYPEHGDLPDFDNMTAMAYGNAFIGFLHVFDGDAGPEQRMTSFVALSADGLRWHRLRHEPFLAQGFSGQEFDAGSVNVSGAWLPLDERRVLLFYSGRARPAEGSREGQGRLVAISLRRDGFAYTTPAHGRPQVVYDCATGDSRLKPTGDGRGYLLTKEFILPGNALFLNAAGTVRVEVVNRATTKAYPGFAREQCIPIAGDAIRAPLRWQRADLAALQGRPVMLRFVLEPGARLYAMGL